MSDHKKSDHTSKPDSSKKAMPMADKSAKTPANAGKDSSKRK